MKDDKSSRRRGKHSLSVSHTREGGKVELVEDLHASHTSKDRTGRWWRVEWGGVGGGTSQHAGEGGSRARKDFAETFRKQNIKAKCVGRCFQGDFEAVNNSLCSVNLLAKISH